MYDMLGFYKGINTFYTAKHSVSESVWPSG